MLQAVLLARADGGRAFTEDAANTGAVGTNHASAGVAFVHELLSSPVLHAVELAIGRGLVTLIESASCQVDRSTLARVALVGVGLPRWEVDTIVLAALSHGVDNGLDDDSSTVVTTVATTSTDGGIFECSIWGRSLIISLIEEPKEASGDGGGIGIVGIKSINANSALAQRLALKGGLKADIVRIVAAATSLAVARRPTI